MNKIVHYVSPTRDMAKAKSLCGLPIKKIKFCTDDDNILPVTCKWCKQVLLKGE